MEYQKWIQHKSAISRDLVDVAMGRKPGDLIIRNGKLVNVHCALIEEECDVVVYKGIIAFVGNAEAFPVGESTRIIMADKRYILPGLIDSHMHVESSMVDLTSFSAAVLKHGTTTICPDIHEMTNVLGAKALELFHKSAENLPLKVLTAMPVCVPSLPGMEDAGAQIAPKDVEQAYQKGWAALQGEQMNFPGIIFADPGCHSINAESLKADAVMTGHYSTPETGPGLNAFIAAGMSSCHESTDAASAHEKAKRGMYVQQRYGSAWLDLPHLISAFMDHPQMDTRMFTMVTDDVTPLTIAEEGHLIRVLRKAVELGVPPVTAIQMVSINAAQLLRKEQWIGSVAPGRSADILMVNNLLDFEISHVISNGDLVAENGSLIQDIPAFSYPEWALNSMYLEKQSPHDFVLSAPSDELVKVRGIRLIPGMVYTKEQIIEMQPRNGVLESDSQNDIAKICMIYRHEKEIPHDERRAFGFLKGLQFSEDCAYASTVSHDSHNLLVIGQSDTAMALAANTLIESGGGLVVVKDNAVLAHMPLPFAGLMSLDSVEDAALQVKAIEKGIKEIGCPHDAVEMTISLLGLVVLPELHLSNKGLVQLKEGEAPSFVSLLVDE